MAEVTGLVAVPAAALLAVIISTAATAPAEHPGTAYAPCMWFTTGHAIPAHTSRTWCDTGEGLTQMPGLKQK